MTHSPTAPKHRLHHLVAWRKAMDLALKVRELALTIVDREHDPLAGDLLAAATRVATSIAIGHDSDDDGVFLEQLAHARGALARLEVQVLIAERVELVSPTASAPILARVSQLERIVHGLRRAIEKRRAGDDRETEQRPRQRRTVKARAGG
jgi:four helix bundle protein